MMQRAGLRPLDRTFYRRDSRQVAPELLNKLLLMRDGRCGRIVEVEAYRGELDPASHAFRGKTRRNATMYGPAGHLYVYFTYGMHWCCNAVCGDEGVALAVLLRALEPVDGLAAMHTARKACKRDVDLCRGPARLCQALGIDGDFDGADLAGAAGSIAIVDDGVPPPAEPVIKTRIGITRAIDEPWRWYVPGSRYVSRK